MDQEPISTGTTIMAFKYRDGIMFAADSRTSSGIYVASKISNKIEKLADNIIICRSGSAADTQLIMRKIQTEIKKLALVENAKPSVQKAAELASRIVYENRESILVGLIIAGFDDEFRMFKIDPCGNLQKDDNIYLGGSGSRFIYGFCDSLYNTNMNFDEAFRFASECLKLAMRRDVASGGVIRIAAITKEKITRYFVPGNQVLAQ